MKKNTAIERTEWIISESNTNVDGIIMHRFLGTENEVKKILLHNIYLMKMIVFKNMDMM